MRRKALVKKIILIFLGIVVLAAGGLVTYVSMVDWNKYRQEIADKFSEATGKKIEFSGPIRVELWPQPTLNAKNVKIVNPNNMDDILATIDSLNTSISLKSLLKGTTDVRSLSLVGAEIWVRINEKDELNWKNYNKASGSNDVNARLQSLSIQNALVHFENIQHNVKFDLSQFNADIQAESLAGPYRLDGNFVKNQDHFGVAVSVGDFSQLTDIPVNFAITHPKSESFLRFDGVYMPNELAYKGDFSGGAKQTADFANILFGQTVLDETYNIPLQFSVGVEADSEKIKLSSFILKYGNLMEGAGNVSIPLREDKNKQRTIEVKYQLVNLDLRPLLSILKAEYKTFVENGSVYQPDFNLKVAADISSERVVLNDSDTGVLESVSLKGEWSDNALSLDEFYAACAGNTVLTMNGSLVEEKKSPQYFLKVDLDSKDFLMFLNSLGFQLKSYTQSSYRNASVAFNLSGNNTALSADNIKFSMDKMNIDGIVGVTFRDNENIYELQLHADSLNLDNYLPKNENAQGAMENIKADIRNLSFLKWLDIHTVLKADNLIFRTTPMTNVVLVMSAAEGGVNVENLSANNVLDSQLKTSAKISNIGSLDLNFNEFNFYVDSLQFNAFNEKFGIPLPKLKIFDKNKFVAEGKYSGNLHEGKIDVQSSVGENKFNYQGVIKQENEFGFNGKLELKTMNFSELVNDLGGMLKTTANTRGALSCQSNIDGTVSSWNFENSECVFGLANYKGKGNFSKEKNNYRLNSEIEVDDFNIENVVDIQSSKGTSALKRTQEDNFLLRPSFSKDVFVFDLYKNLILDVRLNAQKAVFKDKTFNDLKLHILNSDNILQLNDLSLRNEDIPVKGNIQITYAQSPIVKGHLEGENINLSDLGGKVYQFSGGILSAKADFDMPASSVEEFVNNFSGNIQFNASDVVIKGFNFSEIINDLRQRRRSNGLFQKVRDNLQQGETSFATFSGLVNAEFGNLKFENFTMANNDVQLNVDGTINLPEWRMDENFGVTLANLNDIPPFTFSLSGLMNKPSLDINIENIVKKYDAHWEKLEADRQAHQMAIRQRLEKRMAAAQVKVGEVSELNNKIIPLVEEYQKNSDSDVHKAWYQEKRKRLNEINNVLDEMRGKSHLADFSGADVAKIKDDTLSLQEELQILEKDLKQHYSDDVKARFSQVVENVKTFDSKIVELNDEYQQLLQNKFNELQELGGTQKMVDSKELKDYQDQLAELGDKIRLQVDNFTQQSEDAESLQNDIPALETLTENLKQKQKNMADDYHNMEEIYNQTDELLQQMIREQQIVFDKLKAEKEIEQQKKAAEDAKNLLNEASSESNVIVKREGNVQPVVDVKENHIDDKNAKMIVNINPNAGKQPTLRKVTNEVVNGVSGTIKKSYEEKEQTVQKSVENILLKEVDGAVQKPSGTIVVK